jgi:hypothetical protein
MGTVVVRIITFLGPEDLVRTTQLWMLFFPPPVSKRAK